VFKFVTRRYLLLVVVSSNDAVRKSYFSFVPAVKDVNSNGIK
jgi:hypothetical protein